MKKLGLIGGLCAALALGGPATAQVVGLGTNPQGSLYYTIAAAMTKVVAENSSVKPRIQAYGGTSQWLAIMDGGELAFGLYSAIDANDAFEGAPPYEGKPHKNIRVAAALGPLHFTFFVKDSSPARTVADTKGMRLPTEFPNTLVVVRAINGLIASAGYTQKDYQAHPVTNLLQSANDFEAGKVDLGVLPIGAAGLAKVDATVGGIRFIPLEDTPESRLRIKKALPVAYVDTVKPAPHLVGIKEPVKALAYDVYLAVGKDVPDEVVYKTVKALYENQPALGEAFARYKNFNPAKDMAKTFPIPYHPGAIKLYTEKGVWPPKP